MGFLEILIIGVGLSMDAFAVSICKGLSTRTLKLKHSLICGGYFVTWNPINVCIGVASQGGEVGGMGKVIIRNV